MATRSKKIWTSVIEICANCGGEGSLRKIVSSETVPCNVCGGAGRVRVRKDIVITIEQIKIQLNGTNDENGKMGE